MRGSCKTPWLLPERNPQNQDVQKINNAHLIRGKEGDSEVTAGEKMISNRNHGLLKVDTRHLEKKKGLKKNRMSEATNK